MATLSTHVLDTATGRPAAGVPVALSSAAGALLADAATDADGRVAAIGGELAPGDYRLRFETGGPFYPEIVVTFRIASDDHHHVPLLLSPYGYTTYRGS